MTALEKLRAYTPIDAKTNTAPATDKKTVAGALDRLRAYTPIDAGAKEVKEFDSQAMIKVSPLDTRAKQVKQLVPKQTSSSYYTPEFSKWAETERKGVADTVGALYNTPKKVADFMKTTGKKAEAQGIDKLSKVSDNAIFDGANSYESEYTKWRSTVRNEQDVEKDIKKITSRISSIEANRADDAKKAYYTQGDEGYDTVNSSAQSELEALKKEKALLEEERTWSKYFAYDDLKNNDDFEEKSEYKTTRQDTPIFGIKKYNPLNRREYTEYYSDGDAFDDILYDYINGNADAKAINFEDNRYRKFNNFHFEEMTEDEVKTFNYIYATEGPEKAYEYIEFLEKAIAQTGESTLYRRRRDEIEKEAREFAKAHPVGSSIISILNAPNKITTFPTQVIDLIKNGEINQDADYNRLNFESAATTQAVSENMNDTGKLLYNVAMSLGSYGTTLVASLGNPAAALAIMSASVAGDTVIEARDRGLNNAQALSLGIVAAAAELIMEKIGLDALFGGSWSKSGIRYIAKNALTEGLEEPGTNLINTFADILISGDKSQWQSSIKNYKAQGMTESQAWVNAVKDKALELGIDGIAGALSGAAMSSVFSAPQIVSSFNTTKTTSVDTNGVSEYTYKSSVSTQNVEQSGAGAYSTPLVDLYYKGDGVADTADDVEPIVLKTAEEMYPDARADSIAEGQATVKGANLQKLESLEKELEELGISRHDTKVSFDDEIAGLQFLLSQKRNDTSKTATQLKARIARLERLRDDSLAILDKRIEDVQARIDKMGTPEFKQREQRMSKREEYDLLMQQLIGDSSTWRDKKLGLHYSTNTLRRNLRDIIRKADGTHDIERADAIWDELQGKYNAHEAQLIREANSIKSPYADMKITRAEDAYIQMLGELRHNPDTTLTEDDVSRFYDEHKNEIDTKKVERAIKMARETYDGLFARLNETLREQGMKEIPYREGYFPHFTDEKQGWFARLFNWKIKSNEIPTDIAGLTETFNPERSYQPFNKERKSDITDYSFTKGLDSYVQGALDWIYHIEDIQKRRAFENRIRYEHSDKGAQEEIDKIIAEGHDEETTQALIDKVLETKSNPLNNFVIDFRKQTNTLAGKKSTSDRSTETALNRKFYSVMDNVSSRVSGNMIGGNIRSALTNFISVTQSWGEVSLGSSLKAFGDFISTTFKNDGLTEKSAFLTNRLEKVEKLYKSGWDKVSDGVSIPMEMIDSLSSEVIWRGKYYDNIKAGMSEAQAIYNADVFCSSVMASRSRGEMPTAFEAKNFISRIFTAFQLEVNNQYGYMFKDMPRDLKNEGIGRLIFGYVKMFIGAALFNLVFKELTGNDAAFDPIGMAADTIRDIRDGDENTVSNLVDNIVEELPFVGGYFGGGRFPLESALPYGSVSELIDGLPQDLSRIGNGGLKSIAKELENPATYLFLPTGGGQISKTVKGGIALAKGGSYKTDSKGDEKLQYPYYSDEGAKSVGNAAKALIFGKSSLPTAQDWVEGGFKSYTSDQTRAYEEMKAVGAGEREALELINTIRATEKTKDKRSALRNSNVSDEAKLSLYYNMLASNTESERATLDRISSPSAINVILDIKNADKMHNKAKLILDGTLDSHDRVLLFEEYIGDDSESYDKLIDTGLSEGVAVHLALSLKALEPLGNKTSVSQAQKWDAVAQAGYPEETTLEALKALATEEAQSKRLDLCYDNDVPLKAFTALKLNMSEYDTNGNGSYSAAEYQKAIDGLFPTSYGFVLPGGDNEISLTVQQKAALWQIATGSSSVKNNPYGDYASGIAQAFNDGKASESGTQPKYNLPERKFNLPKREYNFPTRQ